MGSRPRDPGPAPHDPASAALVTDSSGESLRSHGPSASSPATTPLRRARARPRVDLHFVGPLRPECRVPSILEAIKPPVGRRAVASLEPHAPRWLPRMTRVRAGRAKRLSWQSGGGYDRNRVEPRTWSACSQRLSGNDSLDPQGLMATAESVSVRLFGETPSSGATAVGVSSWPVWKSLPDSLSPDAGRTPV